MLTLQENKSVATAESYCEKVSVIAAGFPVFFILVAALVVMTTMTRMIEEERAIIGCLRSLGAGDGKILFKYLFMAAVCCLVAAALGFALGLTALPAAILPAFDTVFFLPAAGLFPRLALCGHHRPSAQFQNSPHRHGGIAQGERIIIVQPEINCKSAPQRRAFCHG